MEERIVHSKRIRAGKRTYFIDVKSTRSDDYYVTITESTRRYRRRGGFYFEKHKVFLYKEDFNKFVEGLNEVITHVKKDLMPDYDFSQFDHVHEDGNEQEEDFVGLFEETEGDTDTIEEEQLKWD